MKKTNWTKEEFQIYLFIYCMNADYNETIEELDILKLKSLDSELYLKTHSEFEQDNDYQSIQKIQYAIDDLGYTKEDIDNLFIEVKDLFLSDGKFDILEQNLMLGLKRVVS